jgi:cyclophilin family peptidyl-prolyl cis-trans isomerase
VVDNGRNIVDQFGHKFDSVYTAFGQVIAGMDVVLKISKVRVIRNDWGEQSQPAQPVTLIKATVIL